MNLEQMKSIGKVVMTVLMAVGAMLGIDVATGDPASQTTAFVVSGSGIKPLPLDGSQPQVTLAEGQGVLLLVGGVPATFVSGDPQAAALTTSPSILDQIQAVESGDPPPRAPRSRE